MDSYFSDPLSAHEAGRQHHLLRHSLPQEERGNESVLRHFDTESVSEAFKAIKKMSQRDLQAKFKVIYGAKTFSNNNNWLRRKLFEAIGVDPAKGAGKKPVGATQKRRKAPSKTVRPLKKAVVQELDHSVAEALLALGELGSVQFSEEENAPSASTSSGVVPPFFDDQGGKNCFGPRSPAADQEVPGNYEKINLFCDPAPDAQVSDGDMRSEEEEAETNPNLFNVYQSTPERAHSNSLPFVQDSVDHASTASNVSQLYAWLLSRQQSGIGSGMSAAAPVVPGEYHFIQTSHPLLPPPIMPVGLGAYGHPLVHYAPAPMHSYHPMVDSMLGAQLPTAPPLFSAAGSN